MTGLTLLPQWAADQLWWASGQLEVLRRMCVDLARLQYNFSDELVLEDTYFQAGEGSACRT